MTDEQFQNYLALLKGLLKISSRERDAIAEELQQHMDDRLAELLRMGVPHDEAVRCALEEFGDAAGIAQRFLQLNQVKRKRLIMRTTFGSFAILGFLALAIMLLPQDRLHQPIIAQSGGAPQSEVHIKPESQQAAGFGMYRNPRDESTIKKLEEPLDANYVDAPLTEVLADIRLQLGVEFVVDREGLEAIGASAEQMLTANMELSKVPAHTLLDLLLDPLGLTYGIRDGILFVTTADNAPKFAEVRVYPVDDLLGGSHVGQGRANFSVSDPSVIVNREVLRRKLREFVAGGDEYGIRSAGKEAVSVVDWFDKAIVDPNVAAQDSYQLRSKELLHILRNAVDCDTWEENGTGEGTLDIYRGVLVVKASRSTHRKLQILLNELNGLAQPLPIPTTEH